VNSNQRIIEKCNQLSKELGCDFVGLAIYNKIGKDLCWRYVVGNRNDKFERIVVRYGKGMAGQVIRTARPMVITSFPNDITGKPTEYPIMLAEQLISAVALPVFSERIPWGVLLAGNRSETGFTGKQEEIVKQMAIQIEALISEGKTYVG
jgi:nitrogen regulatory protein A